MTRSVRVAWLLALLVALASVGAGADTVTVVGGPGEAATLNVTFNAQTNTGFFFLDNTSAIDANITASAPICRRSAAPVSPASTAFLATRRSRPARYSNLPMLPPAPSRTTTQPFSISRLTGPTFANGVFDEGL
jgi:hypothetical protein